MRHRIVNSVSSTGPVLVGTCRDRTDKTDNKTFGMSLGLIAKGTSFDAEDAERALAVNGGCRAGGLCMEVGDCCGGVGGAGRFGGAGKVWNSAR